MLPQDLHIHTVYSIGDSAIVKEQTIELILAVRHAENIGISDHFEYLVDDQTFQSYKEDVREAGFHLGVELSGHELVHEAIRRPIDYFVYHCARDEDYSGLERLVETGKPVIVAHPLMMGTDLDRVPQRCFIEVNNRYIWRSNWKERLKKYVNDRKFVISSDAHQPNWLNQSVARYVCRELGIRESMIFTDRPEARLVLEHSGLN